jgi:hypothetical protein
MKYGGDLISQIQNLNLLIKKAQKEGQNHKEEESQLIILKTQYLSLFEGIFIPDELLRDSLICQILEWYQDQTTVRKMEIRGNRRGRHHLNGKQVFLKLTKTLSTLSLHHLTDCHFHGQWIMQEALARILILLPCLETLELDLMKITGRSQSLALALKEMKHLRSFSFKESFMDSMRDLIDGLQGDVLETLILVFPSCTDSEMIEACCRLLGRSHALTTFSYCLFIPDGIASRHYMHLTPSDASKLCTSISFLKLTSLHLQVDDCYPVIARYIASLISKSSLLEDLKIFCRGKSSDMMMEPIIDSILLSKIKVFSCFGLVFTKENEFNLNRLLNPPHLHLEKMELLKNVKENESLPGVLARFKQHLDSHSLLQGLWFGNAGAMTVTHLVPTRFSLETRGSHPSDVLYRFTTWFGLGRKLLLVSLPLELMREILEKGSMDLGLRRIETKAWLMYLLNRSTILLKDQLCLEGTFSSIQAIYRYFGIDCRLRF